MAVDVPDWTFSTVALGEVVSLATFLATGVENQVDFSNISASYSILDLHYQIRTSAAGGNDFFKVALNNDTSDPNYTYNYWRSVTSGAPATTFSGGGRFSFEVAGNTALAGFTGWGLLRFLRYADSHFLKIMTFEAQDNEGTTFTTAPTHIERGWSVWNNTVAINEITLGGFSGNLLAGSWALLLGYQ